jgi:hypothetical protein
VGVGSGGARVMGSFEFKIQNSKFKISPSETIREQNAYSTVISDSFTTFLGRSWKTLNSFCSTEVEVRNKV